MIYRSGTAPERIPCIKALGIKALGIRALALLVASAAALQGAHPAAAQTAVPAIAPSQVTPHDIAPPHLPYPTAPLDEPAPALAAPVPGAALAIDAGEASIDGAYPEMAAANAGFIASTAHRRLTVAQVFTAARVLEQAYARRGFILARVVVPRQKLASGGDLRVQVIDGFIESVDLTHLPAHLRPAVEARVRPLVGLRHITEARIERALLLSGDLAGLHLRSAMARGFSEGGVRLVIEGQFNRLAAQAGIDNRLPATLGQWQWNGNLAVNNLFQQGDQAYLTTGAGLTDIGQTAGAKAPLGMIGGGLVVPFGADGLTLAGEFLHSRTYIASSAANQPASVGAYARAQLRARDALILNRRQQLSLTLSADLVTQSLSLPAVGTAISRDHYAALRLNAAWQRWLGEASVGLDTTLSQGLGGRHGTALLTNSRAGTSPTFTRLEGTAHGQVPLGGGFGLALTARGASGFGKPQFLSEQFALDADNAVSAFPSGSFNVDSGATLRGEFSFPAIAPVKNTQAALYLYAAAGEGWLARATKVEQSTLKAAALGFGLRLGLMAHATIGAEFGHQFSNIPTRNGDDRVSLTTGLHF